MDGEGLQLAGITTTTAGVEGLSKSLQPTGEVAATDVGTVQVTARLPGKVVQAFVSVGDQVHKGQLIATVDSVDLTQAEAAYQTAKAHAALSFNQLQQQRKLAKFGTLSEPQVEDALRASAAAQAAVNLDQEQIKVDRIALTNTQELVANGSITHKPVEDAQNAYAQAHGTLTQSQVTLHSTKASLDRAKILFEGGVYSKQQLEDAQTAYDNAVASVDQNTIQDKLAADELARQQKIYTQNLNGASSLQQAQSKLLQDQHTLQNDLTALELARKALSRAQTVNKSGIPINQALQQAQDTYDEAVVALTGAENTLKLYGASPNQGITKSLSGHSVYPVSSPIDGVVTARSMVSGQLVDTSTPLVKVVNLDRVFIDAQVYESDLTSIHVGDTLKVRVAAFPDKTFDGRVSYVAKEVNPDTRTIVVRTEVRNPGWLLRPGMFATINVAGQRGSKTVAIPSDAVLQQSGQQVVYVQVAPNQFVQRAVTVGQASGGKVPVLSGVHPGDKIVTVGNLLLQAAQQKLESEKRASA
jgi:RND family efflux transporter MFP subunit